MLATKFGMDMEGANGPDWGARGSRRYIRLAVEASLRRLQTDWIDLYQLHEPDPVTPIEETLAALDELVTEGKVRYIGHSNFAGWQIAEAEFTAAVERAPAVHLRAERVQPARPRGRSRGASGGERLRARLPALLPALQRPAHRQVQPRRRPGRQPDHAHPPAPARDAPWDPIESTRRSATSAE